MRHLLILGAVALLPSVGHAGPPGPERRDMLNEYGQDLGIEPAGAAEAIPVLFATLTAVEAAELDGMRGGFTLPGGMEVRFGFDIETRVNGLPVQRLTLPVSAIGPDGLPRPEIWTSGGAVVTENGGALRVDQTLNGGATRIATEVLGAGVLGLVQNRADGQLVQRSTKVTLDVAGMTGILNRGARQMTIENALGARRALGR